MRFRLVWYDTPHQNKYEADTDQRHEFLGNARDIWTLWFNLTDKLKQRHVEVFHISGSAAHPERGLVGMEDYNL